MKMINHPLNNIVRETCVFLESYAKEVGDKKIEELIEETRQRAIKMADRIGIKNKDIKELYDLHTSCNFSDYPMYLCGEKAPQIKHWKDVFKYVWHLDDPAAEFIIIIRNKDHE